LHMLIDVLVGQFC